MVDTTAPSRPKGPEPHAPFRIAMVGFGNIGTGMVRHITKYGALLNERIEGGLEFVGIAVRDRAAARPVAPPPNTLLTDNWRELVDDPSIDAIVEVIGVGSDGRPSLALEVARATLASGKHFITANKALIAEHGGELQELAAASHVLLLFEASVGAGIPIITSLNGGLAPNRVTAIHGIVNGTCNYILTHMGDDPALALADAVRRAQELGYAEHDPRFDIEGDDAAYKIAILGSLAFGQELHMGDVRTEGITRLGPGEFAWAAANGFALRLLASAVLHPGDLAEASVRPVFIPARHPLAAVRDVNNAILVEADPIGPTLYYGAGAGQESTASGLLADVITAARHWNPDAGDPHPLRLIRGVKALFPADTLRGAHYLRVAGATGPLPGPHGAGAQPLLGENHEGAWLIADASEAEIKSLLGNLSESGISPANICHVRFAFR